MTDRSEVPEIASLDAARARRDHRDARRLLEDLERRIYAALRAMRDRPLPPKSEK